MNWQLSFSAIYDYDTRLHGIELPITLQSGAIKRRLDAKVDTGASHCIFERQHGERLGFDIESGIPERFDTAMGSFPAYGHEVKIESLGIEMTAIVFFAADENFKRNVLGRHGWLNRVRLGLIDYDGKIYLSEYDDPA